MVSSSPKESRGKGGTGQGKRRRQGAWREECLHTLKVKTQTRPYCLEAGMNDA